MFVIFGTKSSLSRILASSTWRFKDITICKRLCMPKGLPNEIFGNKNFALFDFTMGVSKPIIKNTMSNTKPIKWPSKVIVLVLTRLWIFLSGTVTIPYLIPWS